MRKYDGIVIHRSVDRVGVLEVVDDRGIRSLHFGTNPKQSSMSISDPVRLELPYSRAMMSALLFNPSPRKALLVGLGGGSLAKFMLHVFPNCVIDAVECRESVLKLARGFFHLPEDPRLSVTIDDGARYILESAMEREQDYDLIFIDAFDHAGMAQSINGYRFTDACLRLLTPAGILAMNLWGTDSDTYEQSMDSLTLSFDDRLLSLPVRGRGNIIVFGFRTALNRGALKALKTRAAELEARFGLEFPVFLRDLRRYNGSFLQRFFGRANS